MTKINYIVRHLFLFALFIFFAKNAIEKSFELMQKEKPSPWEKFDVHELDKDFLCAITETKKQINYLLSIFGVQTKQNKDPNNNNNNNITALKDMLTQLDAIEKKYTKNSPATFLLGPIGTTSIVLKEQRLEKHLLGIIGDLSNILYVLNNKKAEENTKIASIQAGIVSNNKLISEIT